MVVLVPAMTQIRLEHYLRSVDEGVDGNEDKQQN